jgi:probable HAF family extracellular repeat protein
MQPLESRPFALACLALAAVAGANAASYRIVDLGNRIPGEINSQAGDIAGRSGQQAMVYRNGRWKSLPDNGALESGGGSINEGGDVVGWILDTNYHDQPVMWPRGGPRTDLPLPEGALQGVPTDINSDQVVVGTYYTVAGQNPRCFRWSPADGVVDLGLMARGDFCQPVAINAAGQIVGMATIDKHARRAFLYENGTFRNLGVLGAGSWSEAYAINRQGHVVGFADVNGFDGHAFLWSGGTMKDIGADFSLRYNFANSINDHGEIVGAGWGHDNGTRLHALHFVDGKVIKLSTEVENLGDWELRSATSINNDGVIVGFGRLRGKLRGFELLPINGR